jgi:hypothetical protein
MSRLHPFVPFAALAAAAVIIGCGGSGASSEGGALDRTALADLLKLGLRTNAQAAGGGRQAATREDSDVYFDSWLGLLADPSSTETRSETRYFVDQALTQPGGQAVYEFTSPSPGVFNSTWTEELTAGLRAGYRRSGSWAWSDAQMSYSWSESAQDPMYGSSSSSGSYSPTTGGTYTSRWEKDGVWNEISGVHRPDGSWTQVTRSSLGVTMTLNGTPDGSGTGTITGNSFFLPATLVFDRNGQGEITWSDGTKTPFSLYGADGGGGSSGGGSGSTGGGGSSGGTSSGSGGSDGGGTSSGSGGSGGGSTSSGSGGDDTGGSTSSGSGGGSGGGGTSSGSGGSGGGSTSSGSGGDDTGGSTSSGSGGADTGGSTSSGSGGDIGGTTGSGTSGG